MLQLKTITNESAYWVCSYQLYEKYIISKFSADLGVSHPRKPRASTGTGRDGKGETGSGKKVEGGEGKGKGKGDPLGSFSIQIISRSITFLSRYWPHFLIKFKMRPMKSDHMLIWKPLRTLELNIS